MLSSSSPVTAISMSARSIPARSEHPELGGVAVGDVVLELLLDGQVAAAVVLDHRHLVFLFEQLAGQVPAHLARADDDDVHQETSRTAPSRTALSSMSIATRVGQTVCRPWRSYHSARSGSRMRAITVGTL